MSSAQTPTNAELRLAKQLDAERDRTARLQDELAFTREVLAELVRELRGDALQAALAALDPARRLALRGAERAAFNLTFEAGALLPN